MGGGKPKTAGFDAVLKENSVYGRTSTSLNHSAMFCVSGLVMAVMPTILYVSPLFDVPARESVVQFLVVGLGCGLALAWSYRCVALQRRLELLSGSQMPSLKSSGAAGAKKEREEAQAAFQAKTADLSCAYALASVNAAYLCMWGALAFFMLPKISEDMSSNLNHLLAVSGPSVLLATKGVTLLA